MRPSARSLRIALLAVMAIAASIPAVLYLQGGWHRLEDRAKMALRHLNRKIHYGLGWQLPGTPDLAAFDARLAQKGLRRGDPVFLRVFKSELELELWMKQGERFVLFATYPICYWSGRLGPKLREGDRQSPEGFYTVGKGQLNPNSRWFRSFNLGYPNALEREHGRTGSYLMVHGGCSSIGCYAMTNPVMAEIWELITAALDSGQASFAVHVFPFRLTEARLAAYGDHPWAAFWRELQPGYDLFEATKIPPQINVCQKRYIAAAGDPKAASAVLRAGCPAGAGSSARASSSGRSG